MGKNMNVDSKIVEKLVGYSSDIANMYNRLYLLEVSGKKDSNEYTNVKDLILYTKEKEEKVTDSIPFDNLEYYMDYFLTLDDYSEEVKTEISNKLFHDKKYYITTRIIGHISNRYYVDTPDMQEIEITDSDIAVADSLDKALETLNKKVKEANIEAYHAQTKDVSTIFLDELAKSEKDSKTKEELQRAKYVNAFFAEYLEDLYLRLNFDLTLDVVDLSEFGDIDYILEEAYKSAKKQIKLLLKREVYDDSKEFLKKLSVLKAYLYFLSDDTIVRLINKLYAGKPSNQKVIVARDKIIDAMKDTLNRLPE